MEFFFDIWLITNRILFKRFYFKTPKKTFTLCFFLPWYQWLKKPASSCSFEFYGNDFLLLLAHLNSVFMHCLYVLSHFSFHHHQHLSNQPIGFLHLALFRTFTVCSFCLSRSSHAHGTKQLSAHILYYSRREKTPTESRFEYHIWKKNSKEFRSNIYNTCVLNINWREKKDQHVRNINNVCKSNRSHLNVNMMMAKLPSELISSRNLFISVQFWICFDC